MTPILIVLFGIAITAGLVVLTTLTTLRALRGIGIALSPDLEQHAKVVAAIMGVVLLPTMGILLVLMARKLALP